MLRIFGLSLIIAGSILVTSLALIYFVTLRSVGFQAVESSDSDLESDSESNSEPAKNNDCLEEEIKRLRRDLQKEQN